MKQHVQLHIILKAQAQHTIPFFICINYYALFLMLRIYYKLYF